MKTRLIHGIMLGLALCLTCPVLAAGELCDGRFEFSRAGYCPRTGRSRGEADAEGGADRGGEDIREPWLCLRRGGRVRGPITVAERDC